MAHWQFVAVQLFFPITGIAEKAELEHANRQLGYGRLFACSCFPPGSTKE